MVQKQNDDEPMPKKWAKAREYANFTHKILEEFHGRKCAPQDCFYNKSDITVAFVTGWEEAILSLKIHWVKVEDALPKVGVKVLVLTYNGKILVTFRYIPKDIYGKILGEEEWNGSRNLGNSIIAWLEIPSFEEILQANKDVLKRLKDK